MQSRIAVSSVFLVLCFAAASASAQDTIYSNGPINGTSDAWTINFGFSPSNTFVVTEASTLRGLNFGAWLFPGDVLQSAEVLIGTHEFTNDISDQILAFTQSNCSGNQYGFNVCTESGAFTSSVNLTAGTYWLTLENAVLNSGDPVYWDENEGPSRASESSLGTIPSEAFTLTGSSGTTTSSSTGTVSEPSSIMLFGSGVLGLAGVLRRKLF